MMNKQMVQGLCLAGMSMALAVDVLAEDGTSAAAQANNPLANMTSYSFQNYYIGELTESEESANQFWMRYAKPFSIGESNWLLRASLPVFSLPIDASGTKDTGISDINMFASYLFDTGNPGVSFGLGPLLTAPTATEDELGSEKWSAGFANVLFDATSAKFQYGYLLTWQHSFAGNDDRDDVNAAAFQPFAFYQLGGGTYLRSVPLWVYNFENDSYSVPLGIGIGQVIKKKNKVFNIYVEPQFSVADDGPNQPDWQVFFGFNIQVMD